MAEVIVWRRRRFSSAHRLHSVLLSDEENRAVFGKCNYPYGHGHDYVLEVGVRGPANPETGLVVDRRKLDEYLDRTVTAVFDRRNLNTDIPEFASLPPTTENLLAVLRDRLESEWDTTFPRGVAFHGIRIRETPRNIFEVIVESGEKAARMGSAAVGAVQSETT